MAAVGTDSRAARTLDDLYRSHAGRIYRYAYAMLGNHADAEDVAQTTFVNALRALERGERPRDAGSWLLVIARNIIRQRFRQQRARPPVVELDSDVADGHGADDDHGPTLDELVRALQKIPPSQREAIVMRELEGRTYKEISGILELSTGALETLLFRARRSLADELENLVTCEKAEQAMSKLVDGRLSRKERRRLSEHLAECRSCSHLADRQRKHRRSFKGLALLPLPLSLTLFKGSPTASAAGTLSVIGTGTAVTGGTVGGAGGVAAGGFLAGAGAKAAAVVTAATLAGGVGYGTVTQLEDQNDSTPRAQASAVGSRTIRAEPSRVRSAGGPKGRSATNRGQATRESAELPIARTTPGVSKEPATKIPTATIERGRQHSNTPPKTAGRSATPSSRGGVAGTASEGAEGTAGKAKRSANHATAPHLKAVATKAKTEGPKARTAPRPKPKPREDGVAKAKGNEKAQADVQATSQATAESRGAGTGGGTTPRSKRALGTDDAPETTGATPPGTSAAQAHGNGKK